MKIFAF